MRQKEAAREQNMKAQQGMGGMLGGMMGQRGGYVGMQGGGDPADYRAKLEGMDQTYQDKMDANLYTSEGDYTQEGLKDRWGFTNEAVIDTTWGGNTQFPKKEDLLIQDKWELVIEWNLTSNVMK